MKVNYPVASAASINKIKEAIKPFGGRCAKIVEDKLEYLISEENEKAAYEKLKTQGFIA